MKRRRGNPSGAARRRKAAGRKARAFYGMRRHGADVLPPDEAEALRPWRGCGPALLVAVSVAVAGWAAAKVFS